MFLQANVAQWMLGIVLILSAMGVLLLRKPIYASLSFLLSLLTLAAIYLQFSAEFIAIMQILVYAGAILVMFVFIIILFQNAHEKIAHIPPQSWGPFLTFAGLSLAVALGIFTYDSLSAQRIARTFPDGFGSVRSIGRSLYIEFFFPFEAIILLFLVAVVGSLYLAKKDK